MRRINLGWWAGRMGPATTGSTRGIESQPPLLDDETAIFYVEHPGALGDRAGLVRSDAELKPERLRPGRRGRRATSAVAAEGRKTSTSPICSGTSARVR